MKPYLCLLWAAFVTPLLGAETQDLPYKAAPATEYEKERCKLDLHLPASPSAPFVTVVWFHGGGLKNGDKVNAIAKNLAAQLNSRGIALAAVNYRLFPKVNYPAYLEDAAAAAAWVKAHIAEHGGDPARVVISGHSAGAYLTTMLAVNSALLEAQGLKPEDFPAYLPVAGQTITHTAVREERGIARETPIIDSAAPCYYAKKSTPPILAICAENDMAARVEENLLFLAVMKAAGNESVEFLKVADRTHGSVAGMMKNADDPGLAAVLAFIEKHAPAKP